MDSTLNQLKEMIAQGKLIKEKFDNEGQERLNLAIILDSASRTIENELQKDGADVKALHASLLGAYMYCLESINQEFYLNSPEYRNGFIYNTGSPMYSALADTLKSTCHVKVSSREKLIYTNKFYQFIDKNSAALDLQLKGNTLDSSHIKLRIRNILAKILTVLTNPIAKIVNAAPTEKAITSHMDALPSDYKVAKAKSNADRYWLFKQKENKSRIFLTQLAKAISAVKCEDETNLPPNCFTRSDRIKRGALIYITNCIGNEYHFHFAWSPAHSELYNQCKKILNTSQDENLDEPQKLACITAFKSYIDDHTARGSIEEFGRLNFGAENLLNDIDSPMDGISNDTTLMQQQLGSSLAKNWPATTACATLGMIIGAIPGYGIGSVIGLGVSDGQTLRPIRNMIGDGVNRLATAYFTSSSAGYFSFLLGDFIVSSTLSRAFAKVFEVVGMAAGGAAGGIIGFTFDLSYKGLHEICVRYLDFYDHHPDQMRNADPELVRCLLELPEELFSPDKQNTIRYNLGKVDDKQQKPQQPQPQTEIADATALKMLGR